ncbi:MAG: hypothetical protein JNL32_10915 [Candidatus Kapabacteria bacterium]|nr:hypothetical protein [Candidatus Kapabacteria bacterium]
MKTTVVFRAFLLAALCLAGALPFASCGEKVLDVKPNAGPASFSADSLYITVVDEAGNPIPNADIYYTCWAPTSTSECRASAGVNSSGITKDTSTSLFCIAYPVADFARIQFENSMRQTVTVELTNLAGTKQLAMIANDILQPGMYSFDIAMSMMDSIIAKTHPQKKGISNVYMVRVRFGNDTTLHKRRILVWDGTGLMYGTNARGYVGIAYSSIPFGLQMDRIADNGTKLGTFILQGDYLYVKCGAAGYNDEYGMINAYARTERELRIVLKKK